MTASLSLYAYPQDPTTGSSFLDFPATEPEDQIRFLLVEAIALFIDAHVRHVSVAPQTLNQLLTANPLIALFECN